MARLHYKLSPGGTVVTDPGEKLPINLRIFFSCHPKDHNRYFHRVTDELMNAAPLNVLFYPPEKVNIDEEYFSAFRYLNFIVIPVTRKLLTSKNRTMDVDLPYAIEHHIPVLALMQERGLEKLYKEKFGDIQFLDRNQQDSSGMSYEEKRDRYLHNTLVYMSMNTEEIFSAQIFLSYRKHDRTYARKLMERLHRDPRCWDIIIWYDDFLKPGEDFNNSIREQLDKSDLFLMVETSRMIQQKNYILQEEYPYAKSLGIPMLIAGCESVGMSALQEALEPDGGRIPERVDAYDHEALIQAILSKLGERRKRFSNDEITRAYNLACYYRRGEVVERNSQIAARLFRRAAEGGYPAAMRDLAEMYETGKEIPRDLNEAIYWREKYAEYARKPKRYYAKHLMRDGYEYALREWISTLENAERWDEVQSVYLQLIQIVEDAYKRAGEEAKASELFYCYTRMGMIRKNSRQLIQAKEWYMKCLPLLEQVRSEDKPNKKRFLALGMTFLAEALREENNTEDARACLQVAGEFIGYLRSPEDDLARVLIYNGLGAIDNNMGLLWRAGGIACKIAARRIVKKLLCKKNKKQEKRK